MLSGATIAIDEATSLLEDQQIRCKRLPVSAAFHSPLVAEASSPFGSALVDGIDLFRIAGIETAAAVNPGDPLGFPTGLGFMSADDVSLTMTPLLEQIASAPEPTTTALLALGLLGMGYARRRTH